MKLGDILHKALRLKALEAGSELPENPTLDDFKKEAFRIAQLAKELQSSTPGGHWDQEHWQKISKQIEKIEKMLEPK